MGKDIRLSHEFAASRERVFGALDDHANMGSWLGTPVSIIKRMDDGGVGTIRRIDAGVVKFDEEIVERDVPSRIVYRIVAGLPFLAHHRGEITIDSVGDNHSVVRWHVQLDLKLPGVSTLLGFALGHALKRGLARLDRQLAS